MAFWACTVDRPAKWKFLIIRAFSGVFGVPPASGAPFTGSSWHIHPPQGNLWHARELTRPNADTTHRSLLWTPKADAFAITNIRGYGPRRSPGRPQGFPCPISLINHRPCPGGILKYLEGVPEEQSRWHGECFVFDERIALGHGLRERQTGNSSHE
jgi:hypothetical protein